MSFKLSILLRSLATLLTAACASDLAMSQESVILKGPGGTAAALAFSPDGRSLAAVSNDRLYLWTVSTQELRFAVGGHGGRIGTVAFSPDAKLVAVGALDMKVWAADGGKAVTDLGRQHKG